MRIFLTLGCLFSLISFSSGQFKRKEAECKDNLSDCEKMRDDYQGCDPKSMLYKYVSANCERTCGICVADDDFGGECADELGELICTSFARLNNACAVDSPHYKYARIGCRKTCGECIALGDVSECSDLMGTDLCQSVINQVGGCEGHGQDKYLLANCQMSCGKCNADSAAANCVDTLVSETETDAEANCQAFAKYCNGGPAWLNEKIRADCKKTCDIC